jgi:hypothetical protein
LLSHLLVNRGWGLKICQLLLVAYVAEKAKAPLQLKIFIAKASYFYPHPFKVKINDWPEVKSSPCQQSIAPGRGIYRR